MQINEKKVTFNEYIRMLIGAPYQYMNGCLADWPSSLTIHLFTLGKVNQSTKTIADTMLNYMGV